MICYGLGCLFALAMFDLVVIKEIQNSARYTNVSEKSIFPIMNRLDTNNAIFQHKNAASHTFKLTKYKNKKNIEVLDRPNKKKYLSNFLEKSIRT